MTSAAKGTSAVHSRYAIALMELAEEQKKLDQVEKDLQTLQAMIGDSDDLATVIRSPLINADKREAAMAALADKAKFQDITKNFLGVLSQNRRIDALEGIISAFYAALSKRRGEVVVNVQVAQDMSAKQKKDLQAALSKSIGSDVAMNLKVQPSILGGMIVTVGSKMIDDSVARKLERMRVSMARQSNENDTTKLEEVS